MALNLPTITKSEKNGKKLPVYHQDGKITYWDKKNQICVAKSDLKNIPKEIVAEIF